MIKIEYFLKFSQSLPIRHDFHRAKELLSGQGCP